MNPTQSPIPEEALQAARRSTSPMAEAVTGFQRAAVAMAPQVNATLRQLAQVSQSILDTLHAKYLEVGAPYGETPEGFERWAREVAEATRLQREAEDILQRHAELADMRRLGAEIRARREAEPKST